MLAMVIACYSAYHKIMVVKSSRPHMVLTFLAFATGLGLRFGLHAQPESKGIYIAEYLFVVLSPCGFIAANYVLLGRLSRWMKGDKHLWISPTRITLVFVMSDVVTFLIQVSFPSGSLSRLS